MWAIVSCDHTSCGELWVSMKVEIKLLALFFMFFTSAFVLAKDYSGYPEWRAQTFDSTYHTYWSRDAPNSGITEVYVARGHGEVWIYIRASYSYFTQRLCQGDLTVVQNGATSNVALVDRDSTIFCSSWQMTGGGFQPFRLATIGTPDFDRSAAFALYYARGIPYIEDKIDIPAGNAGTPTFNFTATVVGQGGVTTSTGQTCNSTCVGGFDIGATITLQATATAGYKFSSWGGDCTGVKTCSVLMNRDRAVTANFVELPQYHSTLTVKKSALGSIAGAGGQINCGNGSSSCSAVLQQGQVIALTSAPSSGYFTKKWTGCSSFNGNECNVIVGKKALKISATYGRITK